MRSTPLMIVVVLVCVGFGVSTVNAIDGWGNLKGQIQVVGDKPEIKRETIDRDQATCLSDGEAPLDDNLIVSKTGGLKDVFVMMYLKGSPIPKVHPSYDVVMKATVELDNKRCRFQPHALFVRSGQNLRLRNSDDVGHNCHIVLLNSEENVNIPTGEFVDVKLNAAERVPGNVVCDIHKWMDAVLLVRDEPYVAITDANGNFEIKNVPAGTWKFQFWHKKTGYMRDLDVPEYKVGRRGEVEIEISEGAILDLGTLKIDGQKFKK